MIIQGNREMLAIRTWRISADQNGLVLDLVLGIMGGNGAIILSMIPALFELLLTVRWGRSVLTK